MSRYINPFTDFGFKKLFGSEPNKDLLIDFLNEVALPADRKISDLQYKPTNYLSVYSTQHLIARKESKMLFLTSTTLKEKLLVVELAKHGYGNNAKTKNKLNLGAGLGEFPLDLIFKLPAKNNRRSIFGAGGRYIYDLAWENDPIALEQIIYKNATYFKYEAFVGLQLFSRKIVATPEFKISRGVGKVLTYQNKAVLTDTYFTAVPTNLTISLTISGN